MQFTRQQLLMAAIAVLAVVALALLIAIVRRRRAKTPSEETSEGFQTGAEEYSLYFFRANWCGYCKQFKPIWDDFVDECNNSDSFKNVAIVELDVDEESSKELLKKYDVKGFPHVVLVHNARDERMVFDRERSKEQLMKFMKEKTM